MLAYCAHIPHSPLLLPQISRGKFRQFKKMSNAVGVVRNDIAQRNCETVVLLCPYASPHEAHFLNVAPRYLASFESLGNFDLRMSCGTDLDAAYRIRRHAAGACPVSSVTRERLDAATAAAAIQLIGDNKECRVLPVHAAGLAPLAHAREFGKKMRDALEDAHSRIAVVSLGDFSRTTKRTADLGRARDLALVEQLQGGDTQGFMESETPQAREFSIGAMRPLNVLLGLLDGVRHRAEVLNYEQKYGVGMLAARFV